MKKAVRDILEGRFNKIMAVYTDADIQLDEFLAKFEPQLDLVRQYGALASFRWPEPRTIDNLEWVKGHINPKLMTADALRSSGVDKARMQGILTVEQWVNELKTARNAK